MPKLGMGPIRKAQLIQATFECIHLYGFAGTTIAKVSQRAGVSVGIVSHYFDGKDGLLEATMRDLLKKLGTAIKPDPTGDKDPKARIIAIIHGNFSEEQVTPEAITVWLAFWGQALHVPALARLQAVNIARLKSNLRYWLKQLTDREHAYIASEGLAALIDGLWLRGGFHKGGVDQDFAKKLCLDYLDLQLSKRNR